MNVLYTTADSRLQVSLEGGGPKDIFKGIAVFQEIFESEKCGMCGNEETIFNVRTIDGNDYFEKRCQKCHAALAFGQAKTGGGLFPKRKDSDGNWDNENQGWSRYTPKKEA